jgi:predicted secreted protein
MARSIRLSRLSTSFTLLLGLVLAGCAGPGPVSDVSEADEALSLRPGQTFTVTLPAEPEQGRVWTPVRYDDQIISLRDSELSSDQQQQRFHFETVAPGETELLLRFGQPWNIDRSPERTHRLQVTVQE